MGFLDRLVGDLVADATGIKARHVRGLVRTVGAKNLLMLGGAALAGGMAAMQSTGGNPAQTPPRRPDLPPVPGAAPPPLPPVPGATAAPPHLPALPGSPPDELAPETALTIARTLVAAAVADGHLSETERRAVQRRLSESGLSPEQRSRIEQDLQEPAAPEVLALAARDEADREMLYRLAAVMMAADGSVDAAETEWLQRFARALELSPERAEALRRATT